MLYNGYYKVMSNIPKMGQLPTPDEIKEFLFLSPDKSMDEMVPYILPALVL